MFRTLLLSLAASASFLAASPQPKPFRQPLVFEPNRGQAQPLANWIARGPGYQLALADDGVTIFFVESGAKTGTSLHMKLVGGRPWRHVIGLEPTGGVSNYPSDNSTRPSCNNIPNYSRINISDVYAGVDLNFYSKQDHLEYDFVVHPGADPKQIQLEFSGQAGMSLDKHSGDLVLTTANGGQVRQANPLVYQQTDRRVEVTSSYELLNGNRVAFQLGAYDRRRPLIIDPIVNFSTFLNSAQAQAVTVDKQGNSYITGTAGQGFLVTDRSTYQHCRHSTFGFCALPVIDNVFVTKLDSAGTILFSTYQGLGYGDAIAVDSTGIYVAATVQDSEETDSPYGGGLNLQILKLSPYGTPIYSQVLALADEDGAEGIAVDSQHNAWVAGYTYSNSSSSNRNSDVWLVKVNPQGSVVLSQTIGGQSNDLAFGIAIDNADNPWITGQTCSGDFPATPGLNNLRENCGILIMALTNQSPASIRFASVFAGSANGDAGTAIALNANNEAYVTGVTSGLLFPVEPGAYQPFPSSSGSQAFVSKLDYNGHLIYSTLLGGDGDTQGRSIALNAAGEVYIAGYTSSTNFPGNGPMNLGPQLTAGFMTKFSPDLSRLLYSRQTGDIASGIATLESLPTVIPAQIYVVGTQNFGDSDHAFIDRLTDDQQFNHLRNFWIQDRLINIETGSPTAGQIGPDWWSADWYLDVPPSSVRATPQSFWIRNRWKSNLYLNLESGTLQSTTIQPDWLTAQWIFEPAYANLYRIRNVWSSDWCLNIQSGTLTASPVQPGWWSAWWIVERAY